ncbi:hypothetical protein V1264_022235 [Littorina saxatilis]|uniref:Uncharacterized protein n=1 Tax=Littorina saxatilis TaxID=31220 RepID=A0AAN9AK24_9CAEN
MQASRSRLLLCPLQIGQAVQMHHCFDSKFLIDTLYSLGFCSSYKEVLTYEMNAAVSENNVAFQVDGHFTQYIADNLDHNTATLDGWNTFHGMGMIATVTPIIGKTDRIRRRTDVKPEEIVKRAKVDIQYYNRQACDGLLKLKFEHLENVFVEDVTSKVDLLWKACWLLQPDRPSWSGFMQAIHKGRYPGQSSIIFMPMIDMNPSDTTCIFSTLHFISAQEKRSNTTPVLTFDQPLWWKALGIISSEPDGSDLKAIVLRLGPFHLQMSFLACIGHLMEETGLHEMLSTVYAINAASNMLQGKAVLRAVRGHILVDAALSMLLLSDIFRVPLPLLESDTEKNRDKNTQDEQTGTLSTPYESELNVNQVDALSINKDTAVQLHGVLELEAASMKELRNNLQLQTLAEVFLQDNATLQDILSAGEKALVLLYNGSSREGLDELRYRLFCSKVAVGTTFVQIHTLPPTSAAARFHSMRVYLQVQEWMGLKVAMDPTDYG